MARGFWVVLLMMLGLPVVPALAVDPVREQEMAQCLPGEVATWGDGRDVAAVSDPLLFAYDHTSAPPWFSSELVVASLQRAAVSWSACGVAASVVVAPAHGTAPVGTVRVVWGDVQARNNFGLADLGRRTLALGPAAFELLHPRNPAYDASQTLQMVISHEMGHLFGVVAHSKRCVDVTSYYDNGQGQTCQVRGGRPMPKGFEYRAVLPTACDIARCRVANRKPVLP